MIPLKPYHRLRKLQTPFLYLSGRPFGASHILDDRLPRALTEELGDRIVAEREKELYLSLYNSPHEGLPSKDPFVRARTKLLDTEKAPYIKSAPWDWIYRFLLETDDQQFLEGSLQRRDRYIDSVHGFGGYTAHWGTQDWSHLVLDISTLEERLFRTKVDIFAPQGSTELGKRFVVGLYSHRQEFLQGKMSPAEVGKFL